MKENISYSAAMKELEEILSGIQSQAIDVDKLAENVARASELIKYCKAKLKNAEDQITGIFED